MTSEFDAPLAAVIERARARLQQVAPDALAALRDTAALHRLILASDFAIDTLCRQPGLLAGLPAARQPVPALAANDDAQWPGSLRRWRAAESTRLIWRDVAEVDRVEDTLAGSSWIAEQALNAALSALTGQFAQRHGALRNAQGQPQQLIVFGLGKLGGGELNFSSDVDLVYAYDEGGQSDGPRPLDAETYFARIGQRLAQLLGEVTADGFCHRVDLRLRPFGNSGRVALSFAAMEQYFQREGRDWERYAWIKARPVAGDLVAGERLLETLRPFVYRRYLDYGALDGLREMKAMIDAEVQRRELADHLKLGPGGIREVEFLVQAMQLIRGGREPVLRQRALLPALQALADAGHLPVATASALRSAYLFLRRIENRVQMLGDQQTHSLPEDAHLRARIAAGLGYADADTLQIALDGHREVVSDAFAGLLQARRRRAEPSVLAQYWRGLPNAGEATVLEEAGFEQAESHHQRLLDFARSPAVRDLSERARRRLDQVLPALIDAAAHSSAPDAALPRGLGLLQSVVRRTSYLALLEEQPSALHRLVDVVSRSALLSERLAAHPLLLDELLDTRAAGPVPDVADLRAQVEAQSRTLPAGDIEGALSVLNELKQSLLFRIALATLSSRQPASDSAMQLAELAEGLVRAALHLAETEMIAAHGHIPGGGFAVVAYGSVGGRELGFDSDLDLVFLHQGARDAVSDGARPLDAPRYYARLAQKLIALMGTVTAAGRLYEVDMRLRPDGAGGLLVSSLDSFSEYQSQRAWTWEQQALVRARAIAGDEDVCASFERIRRSVLTAVRQTPALLADVVAMRRRMRAELDRSNAARFDLKQGEGGLVDLEFLLQAGVLDRAASHPDLCATTATPELISALTGAGWLDEARGAALQGAHELLLARGLDCTLDRRPRIRPEDEQIRQARDVVRAVCRDCGLAFDAEPSSG